MAEQFQKNLFLDYIKAGAVGDPEASPLGSDLAEGDITHAMLLREVYNPTITERFYTQEDCNRDLVVDQKLLDRIQEGPLAPVATAHQLAWAAAHNSGNAAVSNAATNGLYEHTITRSKAPKLPIFPLADRFEETAGAGGTFYPANVLDGLSLSLEARDVLKLDLDTVGSANRIALTNAYTDKPCVPKAPIFGEDCTHSIGGTSVTDVYETFNFSDKPNIYKDDAHRGAGIDIKSLVTGKRTFEWRMGLIVDEAHAVYAMARDKQTVQCIHRFGKTTDEHCILTLKKVQLRLGAQRRFFIGSASRVGREVIGQVIYDPTDAETPVKWVCKLAQSTRFLLPA